MAPLPKALSNLWRSLAVRLSLAFMLVGLTGALLVALLTGVRTRSEFDRFLSTYDQTYLVEVLRSHYLARGGWAGVADLLAGDPRLSYYSRGITLIDAAGRVVLSRQGLAVGQPAPDELLDACAPIVAEGQTIGRIAFGGPRIDGAWRDPPPEGDFLERVALATALSAGVAALIALALGILLARTLTRPLRALTDATRAMAAGKLGQRVSVRSHGEIGELAASFNQMSADLDQASQLRRQMTADLAHDLRTPLSILRGYTEGLKDQRLSGSPALYTIMHGEVEHLQRMVEDLRVLSLADAGELPLNRRAVDPRALLERAGLAHIVQAEQQGVALAVEAPTELPSVLVDTDRIAQVLNNLLTNALRHTPEGGRVTLRAAQRTDPGPAGILFEVVDTGSGIAAEDLPLIFNRFYRADKARQRTEGTSSGLGLAIARAIVVAHDGTITVRSAPERGTTFSITLPCATL